VVAGGALVGISRTHQYYQPKQPAKDWQTKQLIETTLRNHPSYGHKRLAIHLRINKKRVLRIMKLFGIKPYRRTTPKVYKKPKDSVFPNLLLTETPRGPGDIYSSDFTYIKYHGKWLYVATVIDIYTREIVGVSMLNTHATQLVINALSGAILHRAPPRIIHSDQGSEYSSINYTNLVQSLQIQQSMSSPGCPWENGYQESFYKGFKLDLGDPNRFDTLGELVAGIYQTISYYNQKRIHSALRMPPVLFAEKYQVGVLLKDLEKVS
jgi:transposase InsO family protein